MVHSKAITKHVAVHLLYGCRSHLGMRSATRIIVLHFWSPASSCWMFICFISFLVLSFHHSLGYSLSLLPVRDVLYITYTVFSLPHLISISGQATYFATHKQKGMLELVRWSGDKQWRWGKGVAKDTFNQVRIVFSTIWRSILQVGEGNKGRGRMVIASI